MEIEKENREDEELKENPVEKKTQPKENKDGQEEKQPTIAGIKQRKKDKKGKTKQEASKSTGPSMNQPLWDDLKNAPDDTRILREICEKNEKSNTPTPDTVRLTIKASEALLGTLPKKEKDPGSPLITATVGDVVIRNTLLDLGASVNVLSGYLYDKYKNEELEPAKTVLQLADQSTRVSRGKLTNVIVKVGDFFYPVDFLVMEYESQEDAPALILGRPFWATAGAIIDCKTGDLDIFFGSRKRRLNMLGSPISLPQGYDNKNLDSSLLMKPGVRDKRTIWTRPGEGGKEEVLKDTKEHPLSTIDKEQLLDMMEMLEARHQQYEKDAREREAKVFQLMEAQQQWISGEFKKNRSRNSIIGPRQVWGCFEESLIFDDRTAGRQIARSGIVNQPDAQGLIWEHARRGSFISAPRELIGRIPSILRLDHDFGPGIENSCSPRCALMSFRLEHPFLQFPAELDSSVEYISRRDALISRWVLEATIIDRDILRDAGLWGEIEPFLHHTWVDGEARFTCRGWDRLMATEEDTEGGEKVSGEDMTYIWVLLDPSRFLHLPFALAVSLSTRATGASASSPLTRGHYITRLARSYRILTAATMASLTALPPVRTTARALENTGLIEKQRPGQYVRVATEAAQDPQPAYAQPGRRRRRPAAPADPAPPQPQQEEATELRRLQDRVARMEDQLEWIGEVLLELATQEGQRPRPFPARAHDHEAGSSRPPGGD
ncbi:hypothetical protein L2E82_09775 [Cichorium intybus]|uniref:Uncharacterized protein n=1 Tax=Cichorium intybus TaxID=13427 RepID=A0ACB9GA81_CICIN|nr:hypothetical protein L2E82_09775 [Cichorium intybus]